MMEGAATVTAAILLLYVPVLPTVLAATAALRLPVRFLLTFILVGLVGTVMGMPFPTGLSCLTGSSAGLVPWAWGINGCLSVVGSALAATISTRHGFNAVLLLAAVAYLITAVTATSASLFRRQLK